MASIRKRLRSRRRVQIPSFPEIEQEIVLQGVSLNTSNLREKCHVLRSLDCSTSLKNQIERLQLRDNPSYRFVTVEIQLNGSFQHLKNTISNMKLLDNPTLLQTLGQIVSPGRQSLIFFREDYICDGLTLLQYLTDSFDFDQQSRHMRQIPNAILEKLTHVILKALYYLQVDQRIKLIDLKLEQIFVSATGQFKLGDFFESKLGNELEHRFILSPNYFVFAPEYLRGDPDIQKSVIFCVGMIIASFAQGKYVIPTEGSLMNRIHYYPGISDNRIRMPKSCHPELCYCMDACLENSVEDRPGFFTSGSTHPMLTESSIFKRDSDEFVSQSEVLSWLYNLRAEGLDLDSNLIY